MLRLFRNAVSGLRSDSSAFLFRFLSYRSEACGSPPREPARNIGRDEMLLRVAPPRNCFSIRLARILWREIRAPAGRARHAVF
jgi:hypothetical protein